MSRDIPARLWVPVLAACLLFALPFLPKSDVVQNIAFLGALVLGLYFAIYAALVRHFGLTVGCVVGGFVAALVLSAATIPPEEVAARAERAEQAQQAWQAGEAERQVQAFTQEDLDWFRNNGRSPRDPHILRCMRETAAVYPWFCNVDASYDKCRDQMGSPQACLPLPGTEPGGALDQEIARDRRNDALAQERLDEARRNMRAVCADDPSYAARNPVTCNQ